MGPQKIPYDFGKVGTMNNNNDVDTSFSNANQFTSMVLASGVPRATAAERRKQAMAARRSALAMLKEGGIGVDGLVVIGAVDPDVGKIRLLTVMGALGWDKVAAVDALLRIGLGKDRRIDWFVDRDGRPQLLDAFCAIAARAGRPELPPDWYLR